MERLHAQIEARNEKFDRIDAVQIFVSPPSGVAPEMTLLLQDDSVVKYGEASNQKLKEVDASDKWREESKVKPGLTTPVLENCLYTSSHVVRYWTLQCLDRLRISQDADQIWYGFVSHFPLLINIPQHRRSDDGVLTAAMGLLVLLCESTTGRRRVLQVPTSCKNSLPSSHGNSTERLTGLR